MTMKQNYDEASLIQNYPLGMRYAMDDRVFKYARASPFPNWTVDTGGTPLQMQFGAKSSLLQFVQDGAVVATAVAGNQIVVTVAATDAARFLNNPAQPAGNGLIAENELAGGYICIWPAPGNFGYHRKILRNTATAVGGGAMTVTMDRPVPPIPPGSTASLRASDYAAVFSCDEAIPVVGIAQVQATALQYLWLQTWGPCWATGSALVGSGALFNNHQVVFGQNGSMQVHVPLADADNYAQHAGYAMNGFWPIGTGGFGIFLQISP